MRRTIVSLTVVVGVLGGAGLKPAPAASIARTAQEPARPTFRADSDLVVLRINVTNRSGGPVSTLRQDDFIVYEDGRPQPISFFSNEDVPVTVGLVIDNSSSMGTKRYQVITAALAFANASHADDELFVVHFNEHIRDGLPSDQPFTNDPHVLRSALLHVGAAGRTALYDAVGYALAYLERGRHDVKILLVLSDGRDNASATTFDELAAKAAASDAVIYTVGLFEQSDPDANPGVLKRLARLSGGDAFVPGDVDDVIPLLQRIAHEIRTAYTIGYVPINPKRDGVFRKLRVSVRESGRDLRVRHREGYIPGR